MPTNFSERTFDTRPDRIDYRDLPYRARLKSLPNEHPDQEIIDQHFEAYSDAFVRDQGTEGSCTGFGLAAMIHYLLWKKELDTQDGEEIERVSPRMLYHLAKIYDEWDGEDYEGSSCRGAMKGWHHHGVCSEALWPYFDEDHTPDDDQRAPFIAPTDGWDADAIERPLGAYYRIDRTSLTDLQSAIHEVGAIYVSSYVHTGWQLDEHQGGLPAITPGGERTGVHAYAIVGYRRDGFLIQNSWGKDWGYYGFALLSYQDWMRDGVDAWVAALGAPKDLESSPKNRVHRSDPENRDARPAEAKQLVPAGRVFSNLKVKPLSADEAFDHMLVFGNNGKPALRRTESGTAESELEFKTITKPQAWLTARNSNRICVYFHGGLNGEKKALRRAQVLAPYFLENDIYPIFVAWKTGLRESIGQIVGDFFLGTPEADRAEGILDRIKRTVSAGWDRTLEISARGLGRPIWSEMKENAELAGRVRGGLGLLHRNLETLSQRVQSLQIHTVGHSAGSLPVGHWLRKYLRKSTSKLKLESCTLWAPACTLEFALRHFVSDPDDNGQRGRVPGLGAKVVCEILDDEAERADTVGPYRKSLLYLVSRSFEADRKSPLLGMEMAWNKQSIKDGMWNDDGNDHVEEWVHLKKTVANLTVRPLTSQQARTDGAKSIDPTHGHFDNEIGIVSDLLRRIRGGGTLPTKVEFLDY